MPVSPEQVLQNFHGIYQGIGLDLCLTSSSYITVEGGVEPLDPPRRGHGHGVNQLGQQGECDSAANLPINTLITKRAVIRLDNCERPMKLRASPLLQSPPQNQNLQSKKKPRTQLWNPSMMPHQSLPCPRGGVPRGTYPQGVLIDN